MHAKNDTSAISIVIAMQQERESMSENVEEREERHCMWTEHSHSSRVRAFSLNTYKVFILLLRRVHRVFVMPTRLFAFRAIPLFVSFLLLYSLVLLLSLSF